MGTGDPGFYAGIMVQTQRIQSTQRKTLISFVTLWFKKGNNMPAISGQKTVTTAGTAVTLGTVEIGGPLMVKALDTNTDIIAIGNDGANDVTVSNGLRLEAGDTVIFDLVGNLSGLYIDSAVNDEGVSWIALRP